MSKSLITVIGLVVSIGVIALGFFLVALPIYLQSIAVDAQTTTVASTNAVYQAQVDSLRGQEENLDEINAAVAGLRAQIPATGQFDDVFEVIGRAAASEVAIVSVTAGEPVAFVERTGSTAASATVEPVPEAGAATDGEGTESAATDPDSGPARQQVDFEIQVIAPDIARVTAFLDALRAGPRLLSSITAIATTTGEGTIGVQVAAQTYVAPEG